MKTSPEPQTTLTSFPAHLFPDGSYMVRRSSQEIEVWGVNISEHYTIRVETTDETKMDVIYLGISQHPLEH